MSVQNTFGENEKCSICQISEIDSLNYGEIHVKKELAVHLFCLYFSTYLPQTGQDNAGIVGFEIRHIRKLIKSSVNVICCYCHKGYATTHCHYPNCGRTFHQVCGFKVNARFEYLGQFRSFCDQHNHIENEDLHYPPFVGCYICYESLGDHHPVTTVPSCFNGRCGQWFHQQCLRMYAINAGYAFMCPTCTDKNYGDFARRHGIYVPEYEALWEKTHDYRDIERFYEHCDATDCLCPNGRTFANAKWNLQLCSCCGSFGFHMLCRPEAERNDIIICNICTNVATKHENSQQDIVTIPSATIPSSFNEKMEANNEMATIDLTNDNVLEENVASDDLIIIDLLDDDSHKENIASEDVIIVEKDVPMKSTMTELEAKRAKELAEAPIRNEMTDYRISLWFRDYAKYFNELDLSHE